MAMWHSGVAGNEEDGGISFRAPIPGLQVGSRVPSQDIGGVILLPLVSQV